ncbi:hypothetical protein G3M48_006716, partial [Beauveria asiatica]
FAGRHRTSYYSGARVVIARRSDGIQILSLGCGRTWNSSNDKGIQVYTVSGKRR